MVTRPSPHGLHRIVIPGWQPTLLNRFANQHWSRRSKLKAEDRRVIREAVAKCEIPLAITTLQVGLIITLIPKQRAGDPDGYQKTVGDGLVHAGALVQDSHRWVEWTSPEEGKKPVEFLRSKEGARTEIVLGVSPRPDCCCLKPREVVVRQAVVFCEPYAMASTDNQLRTLLGAVKNDLYPLPASTDPELLRDTVVERLDLVLSRRAKKRTKKIEAALVGATSAPAGKRRPR